jgi:hypothetical protein
VGVGFNGLRVRVGTGVIVRIGATRGAGDDVTTGAIDAIVGAMRSAAEAPGTAVGRDARLGVASADRADEVGVGTVDDCGVDCRASVAAGAVRGAL